MAKFTDEQARLFAGIKGDIARETALSFIEGGYNNQAKAYLAACEKLGKKPSKNPATSACELLKKSNVSNFIDSVRLSNAEKVGIDAMWVLKSAVEAFKFNSREVSDNEGNPKMINASAAAKFLELTGKHVKVKAFEKEVNQEIHHQSVMVVPSADSAEDWEAQARAHQEKQLSNDS